MSFSGFADEDQKSSASKDLVKAKLAKKCKCVRWGSPKFYQLIMNDIPLLFCLPFAYIFGLMDIGNAAIGLFLIFLDTCFMIFYLSYDEELSIDAKSVFKLTQKRTSENEERIKKLLGSNDEDQQSEIYIEDMSQHNSSILV